jgi:hypothetical protein
VADNKFCINYIASAHQKKKNPSSNCNYQNTTWLPSPVKSKPKTPFIASILYLRWKQIRIKFKRTRIVVITLPVCPWRVLQQTRSVGPKLTGLLSCALAYLATAATHNNFNQIHFLLFLSNTKRKERSKVEMIITICIK